MRFEILIDFLYANLKLRRRNGLNELLKHEIEYVLSSKIQKMPLLSGVGKILT
jgi:hypothetical protein